MASSRLKHELSEELTEKKKGSITTIYFVMSDTGRTNLVVSSGILKIDNVCSTE